MEPEMKHKNTCMVFDCDDSTDWIKLTAKGKYTNIRYCNKHFESWAKPEQIWTEKNAKQWKKVVHNDTNN